MYFNVRSLFRKTGWANQQASAADVVEIKSDTFPDDMNDKIEKVNTAMNQLIGTSLTTMIGQVDPTAQQALLTAGPAGALGILCHRPNLRVWQMQCWIWRLV